VIGSGGEVGVIVVVI